MGPESWLISYAFVQCPLCTCPMKLLGGRAAKMVEVRGNRILDFFFSKNDRTNNSLYLLAFRYTDQAQIQTAFKVTSGDVRGSLECEVDMGPKDSITELG